MIGQVKSIGKGGRGIVWCDEKPVFVDRVLPGETVEFSLTEKRRSIWFGSLTKVLEASADRVVPPCEYYSRCGGCNFQHIAYPRQIEIKKNILITNLKKISRMKPVPRVREFTSPAFGYRTKIILKVRNGRIGFLQRASHRLVEIRKCLLLPADGENLLATIARHSRVKNTENGEIISIGDDREFSALIKQGNSIHFLTEKKEIIFKVREFFFWYSPTNFIQANRFILNPMLELVSENIKKRPSRYAIDLYSGTGFFTIPLSLKSKKVTAIEIDPENLASMAKNLEANGIANVTPLKADIGTVSLPPADTILADPPRTGLNQHIIDHMTRRPETRIFYFSCDSATFSRDIAAFHSEGYRVSNLTLIDNFPQTDHFEIFCTLFRTGNRIR